MKESLKFDCSKIFHFANESEVGALSTQAHEAFKALREGTCPGNDFLGWMDLPVQMTEAEIADIEKTAADLRTRTQVMVVIGIGGS